MGFTFQINPEVEFIHDEQLLAKAEKYRPQLKRQLIQPTQLVEIVADEAAFNGFMAVPAEISLAALPQQVWYKNERIVIDLGDHYVGRFSVNVAAQGSPMDAPAHLQLTFAETPAEIGLAAADYDGWLSSSWIAEEQVHLDVLPAVLTFERRYACRYIELHVLNTSPKWGVVFSEPKFVHESAVDRAAVLPLAMSDPILQAIDRVSIKTLADCMQTVYEDGPKRDRRLWLGDLRLQALANYQTFQDTALVKRCLYLFAGMATKEGRLSAAVFTSPDNCPDDSFLFDYNLFFISCLHDFLQFQMDRELLRDLYPTAVKALKQALSYVTADGRLVLAPDFPAFIDWSNEIDKTAASQGVLIYVLKQAVQLARWQEDQGDLQLFRQTLKRASAYARRQLFDQAKGLFVSGPQQEINIASQVWLVLAGVLTAAENQQLMNKAYQQLFPVTGIATPYMYHHIAEALFLAQMPEEACQLLKSYWGRMLELGADTFWEAFKPEEQSFSPYGSPLVNSYCHAWSCTPTYLLRKYCCGKC